MIYKEHGLAEGIAIYKALNKAGIEITSYVAPQDITTDVICVVDTTRHDAEIREDERRKCLDMLLQALCMSCNQEACEGGMVGSIQECETIRMLKDVIEEVKEEMKGDRE